MEFTRTRPLRGPGAPGPYGLETTPIYFLAPVTSVAPLHFHSHLPFSLLSLYSSLPSPTAHINPIEGRISY